MPPSEAPLPGSGVTARCDGLHKTYVSSTGDVAALVDVTAEFPPGRITCVAGPSGSGKSTLLRLLACMDRPDGGLVEVAGVDVGRLRARKRRALRRRTVGYVFSDPAANLVDYLPAVEQVRLGARLRGRVQDVDGVDGVEAADAADAAGLLTMVGLAERRRHLPRRLSGGEQQRLAVACALAGGPAVVVADEPTAQLDHDSGQAVLRALGEIAARDVAVIVASHDPELTAAADRVLTLADGRMVRG